ncbi:unnamed protein product, partial [Prorocentrum cordatum]
SPPPGSRRRAMPLQLRVLDGAGRPVCAVEARPAWCIRDLKEAVEESAGVPLEEQVLLSGAVELRDAEAVGSLFPDGAASLLLVRRPAGRSRWLASVAADGLVLQAAPPAIRADRQASAPRRVADSLKGQAFSEGGGAPRQAWVIGRPGGRPEPSQRARPL